MYPKGKIEQKNASKTTINEYKRIMTSKLLKSNNGMVLYHMSLRGLYD